MFENEGVTGNATEPLGSGSSGRLRDFCRVAVIVGTSIGRSPFRHSVTGVAHKGTKLKDRVVNDASSRTCRPSNWQTNAIKKKQHILRETSRKRYGPTDQPTDGEGLLYRCRDASIKGTSLLKPRTCIGNIALDAVVFVLLSRGRNCARIGALVRLPTRT